MMNYDIYSLFDRIRVRPEMYMGVKRLTNVRSFVVGYEMAMQDVGATCISKPNFGDFHDWVSRKLGFFESTAGWEKMILAIELGITPAKVQWENFDAGASRDRLTRAVDRFFTLLDEFRNTQQG